MAADFGLCCLCLPFLAQTLSLSLGLVCCLCSSLGFLCLICGEPSLRFMLYFCPPGLFDYGPGLGSPQASKARLTNDAFLDELKGCEGIVGLLLGPPIWLKPAKKLGQGLARLWTRRPRERRPRNKGWSVAKISHIGIGLGMASCIFPSAYASTTGCIVSCSTEALVPHSSMFSLGPGASTHTPDHLCNCNHHGRS